MSAVDWVGLVLSFILTWSVGLGAPAIVRYVVFRRPMRRNEALGWAVGLGFGELMLWTLLGSESKTHAVLILIGWVSYRIMQRPTGRWDVGARRPKENASVTVPSSVREGPLGAARVLPRESRGPHRHEPSLVNPHPSRAQWLVIGVACLTAFWFFWSAEDAYNYLPSQFRLVGGSALAAGTLVFWYLQTGRAHHEPSLVNPSHPSRAQWLAIGVACVTAFWFFWSAEDAYNYLPSQFRLVGWSALAAGALMFWYLQTRRARRD